MLKDLYKNNGYEYVTNVLPTICMVLLLCYQFDIKMSALVIVGLVLSSVLVTYLGLTNYKKPITYIALAVIMIACIYVVTEMVNFNSYIYWLEQLVNGSAKENTVYTMMSVIIVAVVVELPVYFLMKSFTLKFALSAAIIVYMVYMCYYELRVDKFCVITMVLFVLLVSTEMIYIKAGNSAEKVKSVMTNLLPVMLILCVALSIMSYPHKRYEWKGIKKMYAVMLEIGDEISERIAPSKQTDPNSDYTVSFSGYTEAGNVEGGDINASKDATVQLVVQLEKKSTRPIYIKGNVSNEFDGKVWKTTNNSKRGYYEHELDTVELLYAIKRNGKEQELFNFVSEESVLVTYKDIKTKAIFAPGKTLNIAMPEGMEYSFNYNVPVLKKTCKPSNTYKLAYLRINQLLLPELIEMNQDYEYSQDKREYFDEWKYTSAFENSDLVLTNINLERVFAEREKRIREQYLGTENISENVKRLAKEVTKNCKTDYEKVKALEEYLRQYEYVKNPPKCPKGKDMMEYFLFESKKGYCTYFATALTLMSRSVDVPARYVQGFVVTTDNCEESPYESNYPYMCEVTNEQAHAWVEVYISGVGFVSLEPTPAYIMLHNSSWQEQETDKPTVPSIQTTIQAVTKTEEGNESGEIFKLLMIVSGVIVATVIIAFILYIVVKVLSYKNRYKKANNVDKMYLDISFILRLTKEMGIGIKPYQTITEYIKYLSSLYEDMTFALKKINDSYTCVRYDNADISEDSLMHFKNTREFFVREAKENVGIWRVVFNCYCKM